MALGPVVAAGKEREVRVWSEHRPFLAKIMHVRQRRRSSAKETAVFEREQLAYMRAMRRLGALRRLPPLAELGGWVVTQNGVAQLVIQVSTATGEPAPNLAKLYFDGALDADLLAKLNHFASELFAWQIVAYDLGPENILLESSRDESRFVLVDGFGDRGALPLKSWIPALNNRKLSSELSDCAQKIGCHWDKNRKLFVPKR